jgi:hypothetical protein
MLPARSGNEGQRITARHWRKTAKAVMLSGATCQMFGDGRFK